MNPASDRGSAAVKLDRSNTYLSPRSEGIRVKNGEHEDELRPPALMVEVCCLFK